MTKKHREEAVEALFHAAQQAMALGMDREGFIASADAAYAALAMHHKAKKKAKAKKRKL